MASEDAIGAVGGVGSSGGSSGSGGANDVMSLLGIGTGDAAGQAPDMAKMIQSMEKVVKALAEILKAMLGESGAKPGSDGKTPGSEQGGGGSSGGGGSGKGGCSGGGGGGSPSSGTQGGGGSSGAGNAGGPGAAGGAAGAGSAAGTGGAAGKNTPATEQQQMLDLVNQARVAEGHKPLTLSDKNTAAAETHSDQMASSGQFEHSDIGSQGLRGENIAKGNTSVEATFKQWMNSPGHRENIMSDDFTEMGIGKSSDGTNWTQNFS
jgi:Cysteine-rich secretory protein family